LGRPAPRVYEAAPRPVPSPGGAVPSGPSAPAAAAEGSEKLEESRQKIGDPSAATAPREPHSLPDPCRHHVVPPGLWPPLKESFQRFSKDQCGTYAASLAFFGLLSLVPIALVAVVALTYLFHNPHEAMARLQQLLAKVIPGRVAQDEIRHLLVERA